MKKLYQVWSDLSSNLTTILGLWCEEPNYLQLRKFALDLYSTIGNKLGWNSISGETDLDKLLRSVVLSNLGGCGDTSVNTEAKKRFDTYLKDEKSLSPDLKDVVFKLVMRSEGEEVYNSMVDLYLKPNNTPEEKIRTLRCMGLTTKPELIKKTLEFDLNSGKVRDQDFYIPIVSCASTPQGREITWDFVKKNWETIHKRFGNAPFLLGRILEYTVSDFTNEGKAKEIEEFFKGKNTAGFERTLKQASETIIGRSIFLKRSRDDVSNWLKQQQELK